MKKTLYKLNNLLFIFLFSPFVFFIVTSYGKTYYSSYITIGTILLAIFNIFIILLELISKEKILKNDTYNLMVIGYNIVCVVEYILLFIMAKLYIYSFSGFFLACLYFIIIIYNFINTEKFKDLFIIKKDKKFKNFICLLLLFVLSAIIFSVPLALLAVLSR